MEVPWNLRRILGYPGQRAPGAGVNSIRFELLYGMKGEIKYPFLRLAEITSRFGQYAGQQPPYLPWRSSKDQLYQYNNFRQLWQKLYPVIITRLSVLEPYDQNQPEQLILTDEQKLSFELRKGADLKYPTSANGAVNPEIPHNPYGLAGSFTWAFESNNIYQALWRNPKAVACELRSPYFSSLGGWGHQKATFDEGRTTIYGDVTMGRVTTINVERIGRIGLFWNKAKHVIIYERTVAASRQFCQEQEKFLGNPIIRKVDEYVEIIENERKFPDNISEPVARGPVLACKFADGKPQRIRVDSKWGEEVGTTGWKIPLWIRNAAPSDVYPKPTVHLVFEGHVPNQPVPIAIEEPDKLFFYTNTEEGKGRNSDLWLQVKDVDYCIVMEKSFVPPDPNSNNNPDAFSAQDDLVKLGTGAFTFALAPNPKPVNIVAQRAEEAISATLKNVTVMRGIATIRKTGSDSEFMKLKNLRDTLANTISPVINRIPLDSTDFDLSKMDVYLNGIQDEINVLRTDVIAFAGKINPKKEIDRLKNRISSQIKYFEPQMFHEVDAAIWRYVKDFCSIAVKIKEDNTDFNENARNELTKKNNNLLAEYEGYLKSLPGMVGEMLGQFQRIIEQLTNAFIKLSEQIDNDIKEINKIAWNDSIIPPEVKAIVEINYAQVTESVKHINFLIAEVSRRWLGDRINNIRTKLIGRFDEIDKASRIVRCSILNNNTKKDAIIDNLKSLSDKIVPMTNQANVLLDEKKEKLNGHIKDIQGIEDILTNRIIEISNFIKCKDVNSWDKIILNNGSLAQDLQLIVIKPASNLKNLVEDKLKTFSNELNKKANELYNLFYPNSSELEGWLNSAFGENIFKNLTGAFKDTQPLQSHIRVELEKVYNSMFHGLSEFTNRLAPLIDAPSDSKIKHILEDKIRLFRGFGEPPRLPNLSFLKLPNIDTPVDCGYYFQKITDKLENLKNVGLTPLVAHANEMMEKVGAEAKDILKSVETKLPTKEILDRFIPCSLENFDLSKIFPNFAGLKLDSLFPDLKMPATSNDRVKITHGTDQQTRSGWLQVDVDVPIDKPASVFDMAGVTLKLLTARFKATSRIESAPGHSPRQTTKGLISGDWDLQIGGFPVAILKDCSLRYEDGGDIRFDVSPERVQLQQMFAFLTDLMAKFGYSDEGFSISVTPMGVCTKLDLPLPDIQMAAFGIANLTLGFQFALNVFPKFNISINLLLAKKRAPFTLTIYVLGGAGFVDFGLTYFPDTGKFTTDVSIGIMASASLAIALGPIKGGVYAYFGIVVEYHTSDEAPAPLAISLVLLFAGEVSLLNIINVGLNLGLEAQYTSGGGLKGRGFVSYHIKICWFVSINVETSVEYTFQEAKGGGRSLFLAVENESAHYKNVAEEYIGMFFEKI
ncbi:MAG: hypothetical protein HW390_606 [Candidatus Brocadiaceae bacterium]|nr:hypothetical protein [Candidatus Brocadiaceae bacterium]